ncbi:unnamed protein product [Owenia fusiformis]|uniref:Uncharacterized protein n=1 Tax=Owenia fusiformis TaxID=6347 RepID=A0A8S4QA01_OWEFU|nr:unnamed protein product [Owenia fusiformis]
MMIYLAFLICLGSRVVISENTTADGCAGELSLNDGSVSVKCINFTTSCIATFKCLPCYTIQGPAHIACIDGVWVSQNSSHCRRKENWCQILQVPANAQISSSHNACGDTVVVSCLKGYSPVNLYRHTCKSNRLWSGKVVAECKKLSNRNNTVQCPDISQPLKTVYLRGGSINNNRVGDIILFGCLRGLSPTSSLKLTCLADGTWNNQLPFCERSNVTCPDIKISNTSKLQIVDGNPKNNAHNNFVKFGCDSGYNIEGKHRLLCLQDGSWNHPIPECTERPVCQDLVVLDRYVYVRPGYGLSANRDGDSVLFGCALGYHSNDPMKLSCNEGTWSSPVPRCTLIVVSCPNLAILDPYLLIVAGQPFDNGNRDSIEFMCKKGFIMMGENVLFCTPDGFWSGGGIVPTCVEASNMCTNITLPEHAIILEGQLMNNTDGDRIGFSCEESYAMNGNPNISCVEQHLMTIHGSHMNLDSGVVWDQPVPECLAANTGDCPDLVMPRYGKIVHGKLVGNRIGDIVSITCLPKYFRWGVKRRVCLEDGTWSKELPICLKYTTPCPHIILPDDSKLVVLKGKLIGNMVNDRVIFDCENGFTIEGIPLLTCLRNITWSYILPTCKLSMCLGSPTSIAHGDIIGLNSRYNIGDSVEYKCNFCYQLIGERIYRCIQGGWNPFNPPSCSRYICQLKDMLLVENGRVLNFLSGGQSSLACGDSLIYVCEAGFILQGDAVVDCDDRGRWSSQKPICLRNATCQDIPRTIPNGKARRVQDRYIEGSIVEYVCHQCYKLSGASTLRCQANQTWDSKVPICSKIRCTDINSLWLPVERVGRSTSSTLYKKVVMKCDFPLTCMIPVVISGCGIPAISSRILGGKEAKPHSWPWAVAMLHDGEIQCGGSIIHPKWILTAAHCVKGLHWGFVVYNFDDPNKWTILLGKHDLANKVENNTMKARVLEIILHENYDYSSFENDIALFKIGASVNYTDTISPICLPYKDILKRNVGKISKTYNCTAIGWGRISMTSAHSNKLRQVTMPTIRHSVCNRDDWYAGQIKKTMFCAGKKDGSVDTCQGDSGGGYSCSYKGHWMLTGLTSWGRGCGREMSPGVYTKLTYYYTWIISTMIAGSPKKTMNNNTKHQSN